MAFTFNFPFICYLSRICNLWRGVYLYYKALLNKARIQVLCTANSYKFLIRTKALNLFRLLENEILKIFSIREKRKSRHKFGETKVCKAEEVRKYFVNPKIVIEVFSYITCSLDFKYISCTLFLLHMKTMKCVVSWYILALLNLFHFIACVSFLSIFFFFLCFL